MQSFLPALIVASAVVGAPLLAAFEPVEGDQAAAVFPLGWSHADVLSATVRADSAIIRFGATSNIGIVQIRSQDTLAALQREGALLLLPPGALGGCRTLTAQSGHFDSDRSSGTDLS